jgi:cytochrome c oxidase subunit 2
MKSNWALKRWALAGVMVMLFLLLPARVWAQSGSQSGSLDAEDISVLFNIVMVMAVVVFILVEGLLIFALVRYRRRSQDEMPEQVHGNTRLEIGWTVGSAVLVIILFFFTLGFYQQPRTLSAEAEPLTIEVTGNMWFWDFYYPETGVRVNSNSNIPLRVPAGQPVVLEITSADVQHSFWVPELAGKVDAIPGRVQRMWFEVEQPRTYVGQCAEYCGKEHYSMLIDIEVMEPQAFAEWYNSEADAIAELAAASEGVDLETEAANLEGNPAAGEVLYTNLGCLACHSLDGTGVVGPSFQGIGQRSAERIEGVDAETYLIESIIYPCDFVVDEYTCVMPQNYGDQLSPQGLADLVAFLLEQ